MSLLTHLQAAMVAAIVRRVVVFRDLKQINWG